MAHRLCKGGEQEGTFVLTGISPSVEKLIKISQLENVLNLVPTVDEAIDYIFMEEIERDLKGGAEE
ncbi:hypothetical protein D3C86_1536050 [compost metagenome]